MNRLSQEKSPYLLQHQNNPVDWYPWGEEAFQKARDENKLIFLSIGYSTCHWCHVMEHDSFEKEEVAHVMNEKYVCIKVDREERPDVDQVYMDAVMALTGRGGWPMSVFLTPDLKPFFGGTFFWKDQFVKVLNALHDMWTNQKDKVFEATQEIVSHLNHVSRQTVDSQSPTAALLKNAYQGFVDNFDRQYGGFGGAPKFPRSTDMQFLMRVYAQNRDENALGMVIKTLDCMARGGIYDHLGYGFHRYATDQIWLTPHFEKMLYDNALLVPAYLEAFQITHKQMYADVAREVLDYVSRDMEGQAFYSAEDADSEGEEGKFYVWRYEELESLLTADEFKLFSEVYGVTKGGNFEHGTNILNLQERFDWNIKKDPLLISAQKKLLQTRKKRIHPLKDDKILTSWNGLMISAMAKGFQVLGNQEYLLSAQKAAQFIQENMYSTGLLKRRYRDGEVRFDAGAEDYAFLIQGLLDLYESDFNEQWFEWALDLQKKQDELFWDSDGHGYFMSVSQDLYLKKKETYDGATPSANSVSTLNLLRMHHMTADLNILDRAMELIKFMGVAAQNFPTGYSYFLNALDFHLNQPREIVVSGSDLKLKSFLDYVRQIFIPNKVMGRAFEGNPKIPFLKNRFSKEEPKIYVCVNGVCQNPINELEDLKKELTK